MSGMRSRVVDVASFFAESREPPFGNDALALARVRAGRVAMAEGVGGLKEQINLQMVLARGESDAAAHSAATVCTSMRNCSPTRRSIISKVFGG